MIVHCDEGFAITVPEAEARARNVAEPENTGQLAHGPMPSRPTCDAERAWSRSEEHTSELQSPCNLVCRLLLEKKKKHNTHSVSPDPSVLPVHPQPHPRAAADLCGALWDTRCTRPDARHPSARCHPVCVPYTRP